MKSIKRIYARILSKYHYKLLFSFFICTLIPLLIIGTIFYNTTIQIAKDSILNSVILTDNQLNVQMNDRIKQIENVADSIQYDMYALTRANQNTSDSFSTLTNIRSDLTLFQSTFQLFHIDIFLPDTQMASSEGLYFHSLKDLDTYYNLSANKTFSGISSIWFYQPDISIPYILDMKNVPHDVIACARILTNQSTAFIDYAYLILLDADEFSTLLKETFQNSNLSSYLLNSDGVILAHNDTKSIGTSLDKEIFQSITSQEETTLHLKNTYYHTVTLDNGWYHVTEIPNSYIYQNTQVLIKTFILTLIFSIPCVFFFIVMFSRNLTHKISKLSFAMESFQLGQENQPVSALLIENKNPESYDEIDKLGITFTKLQHSINQNMQSILELSVSEEKLKYQLLQSQINPHFLYNILGTIKTCQSIGKLDIANQMISNLTQFYRMTLRKSGEKITIRDELEIARLYLEMEQLCRRNELSWEFHLEDGIENYLICKFTLQPFLENSILHGYSAQCSSIHIVISISYDDDDVLITIEDNGCGISASQLEQLQYTLQEKIVNYEHHFGIGNVNKRISSPSFGNGSVTIQSSEGNGTCVTIKFAQMEDEF